MDEYILSYTAEEIDERLKKIDNFDLMFSLLESAVYTSDKSELIALLKKNLGLVDDVEELDITYLAASAYHNGTYTIINIMNEESTDRISLVTMKPTAEVSFPVSSNWTGGNLYLLAVPETASATKVTYPGFLCGLQYFNLVDGAYIRTIDTGWLTQNSCEYTVSPGANQYVALNFKKPDNSKFALADVDFSGFSVKFE